jgi:hypothetical protein
MSVGTLTFDRFNGTEQFVIRQAELLLLSGYEDGPCRLCFDFEADDTPLKTLPDTESLHASPAGEFNVSVPNLDITNLEGQIFSIPQGQNDGDWLARIYYVEHDAAKNCTIRVLKRAGDRFRVAIDGYCTDLNFYDGSKADTHFTLEAWFTLRH